MFQGEKIVVTPEDYSFYLNIISLLKITSIYPQIINIFNEELKLTNCIDILNNKQLLNLPINNEIDFISKNSYMFESKDILKIDRDLLVQILKTTSKNLKDKCISQNEFKKEYQETFVGYCFLKNDIKLMNDILNLKDFDFSLKYNVLFYQKAFN